MFLASIVVPQELLPVASTIALLMMCPDETTMGAMETVFIFHSEAGESLLHY